MRLFKHQPIECRKPVLWKTAVAEKYPVTWRHLYSRLFSFDPTPIYQRINDADCLDPHKRQCTVSMKFLFQNEDGKCACGCGAILTGRQRKWATEDCSSFAFMVFAIISGYSDKIRTYRSVLIGGEKCEVCGGQPKLWQSLELDHIHPVKHGGGGGWLSNYQFKCRECHRDKTNKDFGFKQYAKKQPTLF